MDNPGNNNIKNYGNDNMDNSGDNNMKNHSNNNLKNSSNMDNPGNSININGSQPDDNITQDSEMLSGRAFKFGDDISTDLITPGRYFHLRSNLGELAKHVLEDADPEFAKKVGKGDFVVGGRNFGLGSSREHAPTIIKLAGVGAVLAKSFARIFFRNSINIGLPILICDTDKIDDGDKLQIDLRKGVVKNISKNIELAFNPLPEVMIKILSDGGLVEHITKNKGFNL